MFNGIAKGILYLRSREHKNICSFTFVHHCNSISCNSNKERGKKDIYTGKGNKTVSIFRDRKF